MQSLHANKKKKARGNQKQMVMKQSALGDSKLSSERRVYVELHLPHLLQRTPEWVFFNRDWSVGKCLDAACDLVKIKNPNDDPNLAKLRFFDLDTGEPLPNLLLLRNLPPAKERVWLLETDAGIFDE